MAIAFKAANSLGLTLARSFFSKPNTKNQRLSLFVASKVRVLPLFPRPGSGTRFLTMPPPKLGVYEALLHLRDRATKHLIGQLGLAHPAAEVPSLEDSPHRQSVSLSVPVASCSTRLALLPRARRSSA